MLTITKHDKAGQARKRRTAGAFAAALGCGALVASAALGVTAASPAAAGASVSRPTLGLGDLSVTVGPSEAPAVEVTPSSRLDPAGDSVHIAGSGFRPEEPGVYVAFGPGELAEPWQEDPGTYPAAVWVHPGGAGGAQQTELRPDGGFDTELAVAAIPGEQTYAIYTFAAHGSVDRSQDTTTAISFSGQPTSTPSAPPTSTTPATSPPATAAPSASPATPSGEFAEDQVSSGLLDWGVKDSFRSYVSGPIAGGRWTVQGVTDSGGAFRWTSSYGTYDLNARRGNVSFDGSVTFTGHEGALDLTLSRPQVRFGGGTSATLLLDVRSKTLGGKGETVQTAVEFATLDLSASAEAATTTSISYAGIPATLTETGAKGFGGFYEAGTALDPVTLRFAVGGTDVPGGGSASLAHTGGAASSVAVGGVVLIASGVGLVLLGRRRLARS